MLVDGAVPAAGFAAVGSAGGVSCAVTLSVGGGTSLELAFCVVQLIGPVAPEGGRWWLSAGSEVVYQ